MLSQADNCNPFNGVSDADFLYAQQHTSKCSVYKIFVNSPLYYANSSRIRSEFWALRSTQGISTGFAYKQGIARNAAVAYHQRHLPT